MDNKFNKEKIEKLADLLMIGLSSDETKMVLDEFEEIDASISKLTEIDGLENIEPMTHALDDFDFELRDDVIEDSVNISELLQNSDDVDGREVCVPKVVG